LAANRNGGMLRLIASRHDDDDDESAELNRRCWQSADALKSINHAAGDALYVSFKKQIAGTVISSGIKLR